MKKLIASCFGLGYLSPAPGTWGSLPVAVVFVLAGFLGLPATGIFVLMAAILLAASAGCILFAPAAITAENDDPRQVVLDEVAGQAVVFLAVGPLAGNELLLTALAGFFLFRFFDIVKPWPIRKLEKLPAGFGILADDLLAGLYSLVVLQFLLHQNVPGRLAVALPADFFVATISAAFLGLLQGLTEFLPVSSSGHLVLFEKILGFSPEQGDMVLFDLMVHAATVAAIVVVFAGPARRWLTGLFEAGKYGPGLLKIYRRSPAVRLLVLAVVADAVTVSVAIVFEDYFRSARGGLLLLAAMWVVTATILLLADLRRKSRLSLRRFGLVGAAIVGLAQAAAIMPGISRSGATICAAILIGLHRAWAVEFSLLIAVPVILGATIRELFKTPLDCTNASAQVWALAAGAIVAFAVGLQALRLLVKVARKAQMKYFAAYCYLLAVLVALYCLFS